MKIYCSRSELNKALNNVSHSVPVRTTSSILEGIYFRVEDGTMKLTSTDTNMTTENGRFRKISFKRTKKMNFKSTETLTEQNNNNIPDIQ